MLQWWLVCVYSWTSHTTAVTTVNSEGNAALAIQPNAVASKVHATEASHTPPAGMDKIVLTASGNNAIVRREVSSDSKTDLKPYRAHQAITFHHPDWVHYCKHIYLDVGSHLGVQVRKLFEPERYANSPVLPLFDEYFGAADRRARPSKQSGLCALGFEPNPSNTAHLTKLTQDYEKKGWYVHFYPYAVWRAEASLIFNTSYGREDTRGAHLAAAIKEESEEDPGDFPHVRAVDLAMFIKTLPGRKVRMMKLDIGAAQFPVLARLLEERTLCFDSVDVAYINAPTLAPGVNTSMKNWLGNFEKSFTPTFDGIKNAVNAEKCFMKRRTALVQMDDETYYLDPPWKHAKNAIPWIGDRGHAFIRVVTTIFLMLGMTAVLVVVFLLGLHLLFRSGVTDKWLDRQWASFIGSKG